MPRFTPGVPAMRLLVSVASAEEALAALAGGADVIDAKDPIAGALGAVSVQVLRDIDAAIGGVRPISAALGDASDARTIQCAAQTFAACGVSFVKVGFAGIDSADRMAALTAATVLGARAGGGGHCRVVAAAYADAADMPMLPTTVLHTAARAGAAGVLLDTADKGGPGLRERVAPLALAAWVAEAHALGLLVALAGRLTADDLSFVRDAGADIAGVRGAACDGGRTGRINPDRVRLLRALCAPPALAPNRLPLELHPAASRIVDPRAQR
jgi:uncharacterized protein (UPF0264 family)